MLRLVRAVWLGRGKFTSGVVTTRGMVYRPLTGRYRRKELEKKKRDIKDFIDKQNLKSQ